MYSILERFQYSRTLFNNIYNDKCIKIILDQTFIVLTLLKYIFLSN